MCAFESTTARGQGTSDSKREEGREEGGPSRDLPLSSFSFNRAINRQALLLFGRAHIHTHKERARAREIETSPMVCVCFVGQLKVGGGFLSLELASTCGVNMCNPYVCVCQCGCVSLVELEAAATVGDTLPPLGPILPVAPLLVPLLLYKGDGGQRHLCHLALTHTETITLLTRHTDLLDARIPLEDAGHPGKKRLCDPAGQVAGSETGKAGGENTVTRSIIIWWTDYTFGGKLVPVFAAEKVDSLPAMRIFNLIYLLLLLVALLASSYSARPGTQCNDTFCVHCLFFFFLGENNCDGQINVT